MRRWLLILTLLLATAGCASSPPATQPAPMPPSADQRFELSVDQISGRPVLGTATHFDSLPPVAALQWYANGIDQLLQHQSFSAIEALQHALRIDPDSYEAYWALGEAEFDQSGVANQRSIDAFEHAVVLRPDDLQLHLLLARQYLITDNRPKALEHLRLALQTSQYRSNSAAAASVDLLLARILQQDGYSRAALDEYLRLQQRLANPTEALRTDPDLGFLIIAPQWLQLRIAQLCEELGRYDQALATYRPLADSDPINFDLQADVVETLSKLGRDDEAAQRAADLADRFHGSAQSIALLEEVCLAGGYDQGVGRLKRLQRQQPENREILVALADVWDAHGRADSARRLLENAAAQNPQDDQILRKLCDFYAAHDDPIAGPKLLIVQLAARPDSLWRIEPIFDALSRPMRKDALRPALLEKIDVPSNAQAAKLYLVSRAAAFWHRDALARASIESAVKLRPPFAPAFYAALDNLALDPDLSADARAAGAENLAKSAQAGGNAALAAELRGRFLCFQKIFPQAADLLQQAIAASGSMGSSPTLQMTYAAALDGQHKSAQYQLTLRKLVDQYPQFTQAWDALHDSYARSGQQADALKVLAQWLAVDPLNPSVRLYEAQWDFRHGQVELADDRLAKLLEDHPDDPDVLANVESIYSQLGRTEVFLSKLEDLRQRQPANLTLVEAMIGALQAGHPSQAARLLDQTRAAVGADPELLYQLALLYHEIGQDQVYQQLLGEVLKADAANAPANNDLGYCWADAGTHLDRAEQLIRLAVAAEPDNQAFLDSLGWVLYKRGKYAEAARWFQQAITPPEMPDPQILDHFGDDLYRMGRADDATRQWQRSLEQLRIRPVEEQTELRLAVQRKLQDARLGQPVNVAPVVSGEVGPAAHRDQ